MVLTRARFEEICKDLFDRCLIPVQKVIVKAQLNPKVINEIVLVGGSTKIKR